MPMSKIEVPIRPFAADCAELLPAPSKVAPLTPPKGGATNGAIHGWTRRDTLLPAVTGTLGRPGARGVDGVFLCLG